MTREELAGKSKKELTEIAKSFGIKGISKLNRDDLIEHIMLLDPPFSANPELKDDISHHLETTLGINNPLYTQPPLPEHLTGVAVFDPEHYIPPDYNDTRMVLMVRDPYWLYTYWNVNSQTRERFVCAGRKFENLQLVIRVYDVTNVQFDGTNSNYYFDINLNHYTNNWYINVANPNRSFCVDLGYIEDNGKFVTIVRSNTVTTPRDGISEVIDEEWMIIEEDFRKIYRLAAGSGFGNSSVELVESLIKRLEREMGSGAVSSLSSPFGGYQQPKERKFWLVLNTELIVYGATEPDAQVTIQGEPITLRPDGTFTLRFALPDGTQNIPVVAHSADGIDTITITPIVSKQTQ